MADSNLPGGREFFNRFSVLFGAAGALAAAVVLLYLSALLRLPPAQAGSLWWMVLGVAVAITPVCLVVQNRMMRDLVSCLDQLQAGPAPSDVVARGFAAAVDLPRRCAIFGTANFAAGSLVLVVFMRLVFEDFRLDQGVLIFAGAASGGTLAGLIQFFVCKQVLGPIRNGLADLIPDPNERERLVRHLPLVRKIGVVLIAVALVPVVFSVFLAYSRSGASAVALAQRMHVALLERAALEMAARPAPDVDALVARLQGVADGWGIPARLVRVGASDGLSSVELEWIESHPGERLRGDTEPLHEPDVVTWMREPLPGGTEPVTLAVVTPREQLYGGEGTAGLFALVVAFTALVAMVVAWLLARDVGHAARSLERRAARVAEGHLQLERPVESEDELGRLARSFWAMSSALHGTVGSLVETANRVEAAGSQICDGAERVTLESRARVEKTGECVRSMTSVHEQAREIQSAASDLQHLAEESSASVLEMGAAGDQLRDTATSLHEKVDQVSSAMEQSVRSIAEVRDNSVDLAGAAEETSASMEQTAASMRQIDQIAEETSGLSNAVITAAETGQRKVRETIAGMDSIREATNSAQGVIGSLGERMQEIDAVLEVIQEIANRTNLLALNASIIAAQAGEYGRPFAVVAEEIGQLASRVRASSEEIGALIRNLQHEGEAAVGAIEKGGRSVAQGVELAREAGASLDTITSAARDSGERSREIVVGVREQSKAATHVVQMMERVSEGLAAIRRATEEQSRGHQSIAEATRAMQDVATQLRSTTEEQSRGVRQIAASAQGVREASESIHTRIESQTSACEASATLLQQLAAQAETSEESVAEMETSIRELVADSQRLRADTERFKT